MSGNEIEVSSFCAYTCFCCDSVLQGEAVSMFPCKYLILIVCVACAEPDFVGSALVRESSGSKEGDDDKIYFFFTERAMELDCDTEPNVARVARVCKVTPDAADNQNGSQNRFN